MGRARVERLAVRRRVTAARKLHRQRRGLLCSTAPFPSGHLTQLVCWLRQICKSASFDNVRHAVNSAAERAGILQPGSSIRLLQRADVNPSAENNNYCPNNNWTMFTVGPLCRVPWRLIWDNCRYCGIDAKVNWLDFQLLFGAAQPKAEAVGFRSKL